jgi:hypothetical protein
MRFKYLPDISIDFQWMKLMGKISVNTDTDIDINYRGVPEHFYPLSVTLKEFYWSNGTPTNNGHLKMDNKGLAGHTGLDVNLNNITVAFTFPSVPNGLILYYGEYGGNINVEVNGDLKNVQNFADINGAVIGGVNISITNVVGQKGVLNLLGAINSFSIGGQELWIDHVCPRK